MNARSKKVGTPAPIMALAFMLIAAIISFEAAYFSGLHLHILADGRVVVHSHPIDASHKGTHHHTKREFTFLSALGNLIKITQLDFGVLPVVITSLLYFIDITEEGVFSYLATGVLNDRSPPAVNS